MFFRSAVMVYSGSRGQLEIFVGRPRDLWRCIIRRSFAF